MKTIDFYDNEQWGTDGSRETLEHRERIAIALMKKRWEPSLRFLDIGCGEGFFLSQVAQTLPEAELFGVDYSPYRLERAKKRHPFSFSRCNLEESVPFADGEFHMVYSGEVIEHLYNPDLMLQEIHRVLKTNGTLIISTPNLLAWYNRILVLFGIQPLFYETSTATSMIGVGPLRVLKKDTRPVGHVRLFHKRALVDLFHHHGFRIETIKGFVFEGFPGPLKMLDRIMALLPSLASGFVVMARKIG